MAAGEIARGLWSDAGPTGSSGPSEREGKSAAALATLEDAERRYPASIAFA